MELMTMRRLKFSQRFFVLLLLLLWGGYAVLNGLDSAPSLASAYRRGWGFVNKLGTVVETANGQFLYQQKFQELAGYARRALNFQTAKGFSIAKGENGQLDYTNFYPYEIHEYEEPAIRMSLLKRAAEEQGASFLYLNCIDIFNEDENAFGDIPMNNLNHRSNAFLYALQGYGIEYMDVRKVLMASGLAPSLYSYRTEPHWTVEACFEVYAALVGRLNEQGGHIDPEGFYTSPYSFKRIEYPASYLGKIGKIVGAPYSGYDDFTLMLPAYETDFTMSFEEYRNRMVRGDFASVLLDTRWVERDDPYENDAYCTYLTEVYPYRKIVNNKMPDGAKVLVLGDSFMLPVTAFLATAVQEVHLLSPYSLPYGADTLITYLEENDFDHVVIGFNPGTLNDAGFRFLDGIELPDI